MVVGDRSEQRALVTQCFSGNSRTRNLDEHTGLATISEYLNCWWTLRTHCLDGRRGLS